MKSSDTEKRSKENAAIVPRGCNVPLLESRTDSNMMKNGEIEMKSMKCILECTEKETHYYTGILERNCKDRTKYDLKGSQLFPSIFIWPSRNTNLSGCTKDLTSSKDKHNRTGNKIYCRKITGLRKWSTTLSVIFYVFFMTSSFGEANYYKDYVSLAMKSLSKSACDLEYLLIECPEGTSIDILGAMYGRKVPSEKMCPTKQSEVGSGKGEEMIEDTNCEAVTALEKAGAECQDKRICRLLAYHRVFGVDPCPGTSKYLTVQYQCTPKIFHEKDSCSEESIRLRCSQDTVIAMYDVESSTDNDTCNRKTSSNCSTSMTQSFDGISKKCHGKSRCSISEPPASCFNKLKVKYFCVPKSFLSSEIPTYERLQTTTAPITTASHLTTQTVEQSTTREASTVQSTVKFHLRDKGDSLKAALTTSTPVEESKTERALLGNLSADNNATTKPLTTLYIVNTRGLNSSDNSDSGQTTRKDGEVHADVIGRNDFPIIPDASNTMDGSSTTKCTNCSISDEEETFFIIAKLLALIKENQQDIAIAVLLGVVIALLLIICILVFRRKKRGHEEKDSRDLDQVTEETREDNRQNVEEHHSIQEGEEPVEEDEHENMSLLGSMLQRSVDSNNTMNRQHISPNSSYVNANTKHRSGEDEDPEQGACGPKSIFGKICCNCCCSNPPWQRTRILKGRRGDVYHVKHRSWSSSIDDEELRSHETFSRFNRGEDGPDHPSPIPLPEERVNRTDLSVVTPSVVSSTAISPAGAAIASQSQQNFRPISRNTPRHQSVTPEPDSRHRVQHTFQPPIRETQRSDPALNRYSVRQAHSVAQPLTAPTSPVIGHHSTNLPMLNGSHKLVHAYQANAPKPLPVMGSSMLAAHNVPQTPQPPLTPKYTPPPNHFYGTHQYPTFPDSYEQYDNAPETSQAVLRKQFPVRDYTSPYNHSNYHSNNYSGFPTSSHYDGDHFVQAVQRRNVASNARTVDLAANARTVDLSHNNTFSRNSWIEIRRSSIYDNSLPRNSEMFDYYQQFLPQDYQIPSLQPELPGSRNLNQYYP